MTQRNTVRDSIPYIMECTDYFLLHDGFTWSYFQNTINQMKITDETTYEELGKYTDNILYICQHGIIHDLAVYYRFDILTSKEMLIFAVIVDKYIEQILDENLDTAVRLDAVEHLSILFQSLAEYAELLNRTASIVNNKVELNMEAVANIVLTGFKKFWTRVTRKWKRVSQQQVLYTIRVSMLALLANTRIKMPVDEDELRVVTSKYLDAVVKDKLTEETVIKVAPFMPLTRLANTRASVTHWSKIYHMLSQDALDTNEHVCALTSALKYKIRSKIAFLISLYTYYYDEQQALTILRDYHERDLVRKEECETGVESEMAQLLAYKKLDDWITNTIEVVACGIDKDHLMYDTGYFTYAEDLSSLINMYGLRGDDDE